MTLRASKFFGFCYADELAESEFFAKNFQVNVQKNMLVFSFVFMKGLDAEKIKPQKAAYRFFEIEDVYLRNKLIAFIKLNSDLKKMKLHLGDVSIYIKHLKFTHKGFVIQLV